MTSDRADPAGLLGRDYWLVRPAPRPEAAAAIAAQDPFAAAGLRSSEVFGWRVNEGAVQVGLSLGTGRLTWG